MRQRSGDARVVEAHPSVSNLQAVTAAYEQIDLQLRSLRETENGDGEEPGSGPLSNGSRGSTTKHISCSRGASWRRTSRRRVRTPSGNGQSHEDWLHRRAWSLYNPDDGRLSGLILENRLTLVLEKGSDDRKKSDGALQRAQPDRPGQPPVRPDRHPKSDTGLFLFPVVAGAGVRDRGRSGRDSLATAV